MREGRDSRDYYFLQIDTPGRVTWE